MPEPSKITSQSLFKHPFLGRGFRPFFLLGAIYSTISLLIWGGFYAEHVAPPSFMHDPISWHAHEMIYGFTIAIVAGFLLTAVANWTGGAPARQIHLAGLCLVWLAGRIVMNFDLGLTDTSVFVIEAAFLPTLAISLSIPLLKSWNKRNFVFLVMLGILFACNVGFLITANTKLLYIAIMVIIAMISLIGGRVIPAFTVAALRRRGEEAYQTPQGKMDVLALMSLAFIILAFLFIGTQGLILATLAFVSAIIHALRLRHYHTCRILNDPLVWILHAGYGWVIAGLCFVALAALNVFAFSTALHALTVGAIGSMTLGMMCRVSLGHTGRNLIAGKLTMTGFILMQIAAFLRVFGPLLLPAYANECVMGSAALWSICFGIYVVVYTPILWNARPDGKPA